MMYYREKNIEWLESQGFTKSKDVFSVSAINVEDESGDEWTEVVSKKSKKKKKRKGAGNLKVLITVEPEGINSIDKPEWELIEMAVDSGATETVVGEDMLSAIEVKESAASKRGVEYEVANGEKIPNLGEKRFTGISQEGIERSITAQ
eukprot:4642726-Karenia_brevis.AAC.1